MPTINEAKVLILDQFTVGWAEATPIAYEDEEFNKPSDDSAYVRLSIKEMVSRQDTLGTAGNRKYVREGSAFVEIYVPEGAGTKAADDLAELVRTVLEGVRISGGLWFLDTNVRETGPSNAYFAVVCESIFNYEQIK